MGAPRRAKKIDNNQKDIVKALKRIPGVSVQLDMDDILVGYKGQNYWFELKDPETCLNRDGDILESKLKPSQKKLLVSWQGHYSIVTTLQQILDELGI